MYAEKHCSQGFKYLLLDGPCEDVLVQDAFKAVPSSAISVMTTLLTSGVYVRASAPLPVQAQASCSSDASTNVQASAMGIESGRSSPARTSRDFKAKQHCA